MGRTELEEQIRALEGGRAFVRHPDTRLTQVEGSEARGWLQDLVTTDVTGLRRFQTRRSLLLTPTGRIRADFHVLGLGGPRPSFVLVQAADQPEDLAELLRPYVLSSDVELRPAPYELVSIPGVDELPAPGPNAWRPSVLGPGLDLVVGTRSDPAVPAGLAGDLLAHLARAGFVSAGGPAVEAWRIRRGIPRFPIDLDEGSLPAEAGLDDGSVIDRAKGCYLGQESVAKVRNLGHPTRALLAMRSSTPVDAGEAVVRRVADGDEEVGRVTSADATPVGSAVIVRVRWEARDSQLRTGSGVRLHQR